MRRSKHALLLEAHRPLYARLLELQGGRCAVCLTLPSSDRKLDLDHDHRAMVVRGLLCHRCNRQLPSWVSAEWLRAAADYLDNPPAARLPSVASDESGLVATTNEGHASSVPASQAEDAEAA